MLDELMEKWADVQDCADDPLEEALVEEFLDDLRMLKRNG